MTVIGTSEYEGGGAGVAVLPSSSAEELGSASIALMSKCLRPSRGRSVERVLL